MNIFEFMSNSPSLSFFIAYMITVIIIRISFRLFRHLNIRKHGWPPEHCDADGDFEKEDE